MFSAAREKYLQIFLLNAVILGMAVCCLVFIFGQKVDVIAWSTVALIMIFCGIYYPVSTLPAAARIISELIPLTYFLDSFRSLYGFEPVFKFGLLKGFGVAFCYIFIMLNFLQWAYRHACRTGMILRLSE